MGVLTCANKISGTESERLAASKLLGFYGTNLQNPTQALMSCVIPRDGNRFIQPDQGGAEALVVAYECRRGKYRRLFELGVKVHSYMALQIFTEKFRNGHPATRYKQVDPDVFVTYPECRELLKRIKNSEREYHLGKITIHAKSYDMKFRTFQINALEKSEGSIVLSAKEAKDFLAIHEITFPEIVEQQQETINRAKRDGMLRNLFGHPRRFERLWTSETDRQVLSFIPQSTVAVITHLAITELFYRIKKEKLPWLIVNNKHDSFLLEVPDNDEHVQMGIAYSREHMGRELTSSRGETYRMKVGISTGLCWAKYHKDKCPHGMKELD